MKKTVISILLVMLVGVAAFAAANSQGPATAHKSHVMVSPEAIKWGPAPEKWIQGTPPPEFAGPPKFQWAVIQGDPSKPGATYTIRVKGPDGERVPPHWHPQDEHLTVLQGTFVLGMGDKFDQSAGKELTAGSYAVVPKKTMHFAWTKGETVLQVHGIGPFTINFGKPGETGKKPTTSQ